MVSKKALEDAQAIDATATEITTLNENIKEAEKALTESKNNLASIQGKDDADIAKLVVDPLKASVDAAQKKSCYL